MNTSNVRMVNDRSEVAWHRYVDPSDARMTERVKRELAEYRELEPSEGWRLETRGEVAGWHRWRD